MQGRQKYNTILKCLFSNLAAQPDDFPESKNDLPPPPSPNDTNNNMEDPFDPNISFLDEVATVSGHKSEDELYPELGSRATKLAVKEEKSVEPLFQDTSEIAIFLNEQMDTSEIAYEKKPLVDGRRGSESDDSGYNGSPSGCRKRKRNFSDDSESKYLFTYVLKFSVESCSCVSKF